MHILWLGDLKLGLIFKVKKTCRGFHNMLVLLLRLALFKQFLLNYFDVSHWHLWSLVRNVTCIKFFLRQGDFNLTRNLVGVVNLRK